MIKALGVGNYQEAKVQCLTVSMLVNFLRELVV